MKELTNAEEEVMLKLWKLDNATTKQIQEAYDDKQPAYNTVSTIIRILEKKKFIRHRKKGKKYIYYPKILKLDYCNYLLEQMVKDYFDDDYHEMASNIIAIRPLENITQSHS